MRLLGIVFSNSDTCVLYEDGQSGFRVGVIDSGPLLWLGPCGYSRILGIGKR